MQAHALLAAGVPMPAVETKPTAGLSTEPNLRMASMQAAMEAVRLKNRAASVVNMERVTPKNQQELPGAVLIQDSDDA